MMAFWADRQSIWMITMEICRYFGYYQIWAFGILGFYWII
jgi:hypothetical protein